MLIDLIYLSMNLRRLFIVVPALLLVCSACKIATSFRGPGYGANALPIHQGDPEVIVALTHVELGNNKGLNTKFWEFVYAIERQLPQIKGALGHSIRKRLFSDEGWTMTVWSDEQAINDFVSSGLHKESVEKAGGAIKKVQYARLRLPKSKTPISWGEVEVALEKGNKNKF